MNTDSKAISNPATKKDNDEINLLALMLVLLRGWKIIIFFALLGLLVGVLYGRYVNPIYKADALLQVEENSQGISALGDDISGLVGSNASKAETEAELIRSRMILKPVVDSLNLRIRITDPAIGYISRIQSNRTDTQRNTAEGVSLRTEDGQVQVSQFDVSQGYLNKSFTLTRSESGFVLSNGFDEFKGQLNNAYQFKGTDGQVHITVTDLPTAHPVRISKQSLQRTTDAINGSLSVVERGEQTGIIQLSMTGSDQQQITTILRQIVVSYVDQNQSRGSEETTKTLAFMETQIPLLRQKLEESEALFNDFREKNGTIDVTQEAQILLAENSRIDAQLNDLRLKKAELTTYYTEEHPLVIQINEQLAVLNNRQQEIDNTIAGLPEIQREFLGLSQDNEINREIYLTLLKNYEQLKIVKSGQIGYARIIDLPISTFKVIAPKKSIIWLLAILLGTLLGSVLVLIRSLLRSVVKDPEQLEIKTGVPVIATIPRSQLLTRLGKNNKSSNRLLAYADNTSLSYEAIKSLRTNLIFNMPEVGKRAKVIVITGESPGVGKSFISSNLSEVFAQLNKKILIIDADMRLGELHKIFKMPQDNGLGDYLTQPSSSLPIKSLSQQEEEGMLPHSNISKFTYPTDMDNIDFISRGKNPNNPASLLSSDHFSNMIKELSAHYDYIIIDTPPVLAASDAVIVSQYADKVLMVARYDKSIEGQVAYAVKQMNKVNIQVDGIIINDVKQGLMSKYSYNYNYAYGNKN